MESWDFPERQQGTQHQTDLRFAAELEAMLNENETISARSVAAKIRIAASSITRDEWRSQKLDEFSKRQKLHRHLLEQADHQSKTKLAARLADAKREITERDDRIAILIASHCALIYAVGEMGGLPAWEKFFEKYQEVGDYLRSSGAIPEDSPAMFDLGVRLDADDH